MGGSNSSYRNTNWTFYRRQLYFKIKSPMATLRLYTSWIIIFFHTRHVWNSLCEQECPGTRKAKNTMPGSMIGESDI